MCCTRRPPKGTLVCLGPSLPHLSPTTHLYILSIYYVCSGKTGAHSGEPSGFLHSKIFAYTSHRERSSPQQSTLHAWLHSTSVRNALSTGIVFHAQFMDFASYDTGCRSQQIHACPVYTHTHARLAPRGCRDSRKYRRFHQFSIFLFSSNRYFRHSVAPHFIVFSRTAHYFCGLIGVSVCLSVVSSSVISLSRRPFPSLPLFHSSPLPPRKCVHCCLSLGTMLYCCRHVDPAGAAGHQIFDIYIFFKYTTIFCFFQFLCRMHVTGQLGTSSIFKRQSDTTRSCAHTQAGTGSWRRSRLSNRGMTLLHRRGNPLPPPPGQNESSRP